MHEWWYICTTNTFVIDMVWNEATFLRPDMHVLLLSPCFSFSPFFSPFTSPLLLFSPSSPPPFPSSPLPHRYPSKKVVTKKSICAFGKGERGDSWYGWSNGLSTDVQPFSSANFTIPSTSDEIHFVPRYHEEPVHPDDTKVRE